MNNDGLVTKICSKCLIEKSIDLFLNDSRYKDGKYCWCKSCSNKLSYNYRDKNKAKDVAKRYRDSEKGKLNKQRNQHKNPETLLISAKKYRETNRENGKLAERCKQRYHTDPHYRIRLLCGSRVREMLKNQNINKSLKTVELIGCSIETLKLHLESLFTEGMTWENQGEWHIDHKKPCSLFDLVQESEQKQCFHYTNLQPLWALDNIKKSNKY